MAWQINKLDKILLVILAIKQKKKQNWNSKLKAMYNGF